MILRSGLQTLKKKNMSEAKRESGELRCSAAVLFSFLFNHRNI